MTIEEKALELFPVDESDGVFDDIAFAKRQIYRKGAYWAKYGVDMTPDMIGEDNICPRTMKPCDDECCPPTAICNLTTSVDMTRGDIVQTSELQP